MKTAPLMLLAALACAPTIIASPAPAAPAVQDHAHDFDFLVGQWRVHHRRLKARLAGSHEWVEFEGTSKLWMAMDGHATVDDNYIGLPSGPYHAVGVRGYDPKAQTWAIWWLDGRDPHTIGAPVIGNFQNGVGTFEGNDTFNDRPIRVRFVWSRITARSAHWEQAFSPDAGKTWETNWVMDLTRVGR
ncbi:MAG: DUF1579 domain-containing protein [Caulobacteraceae bacterium]|jgi:hypothetical protein